ncbi:PQQ-binding-like beta-propeller repeat protein [Cellulomonas aerilata]|uniref:Uncharacterized protein n=1 Tax=Cellulomonas aerilata TaxID=515326 RepID=A0A512DAS7_9CELL|nr:PQQ-binding-like beta-propeller repeat protein [Cellulomonas aerilata]GEO33568.1 hypothetical protein CAE01nite_12930 [Cellulomonas aerilata]
MGSPRYEMRDVELVEPDDRDAAPSPGRSTAPDATGPGRSATTGTGAADDAVEPDGRRWRRGRSSAPSRPARRAWAAALAAALAVAAGAATLVGDHREQEWLAALADVPGVLAPLEGPVSEAWRTDMPLWIELHDVAGMLVGVTDTRDGTRDVDVVAVDADTGETVWTVPAVRSRLAPLRGVRCVVPDAAEGAEDGERVVACLVVDELGPSPQDLSRYEPTASRLLVLAVATGEVLSETSVDATTSLAAIGTDLVVMQRGTDGGVQVVRTDPLRTREAWRFEGPPREGLEEYTSVRVDDGLVVVPGQSGWVLDGQGDVVTSWSRERPASSSWAEVVGGRTLVRPLRDAVGATSVTDLGSGDSFTVDGYPLTRATDDGTAADVVLVQSSAGEGLEAYERSGDRRWRAEGPDAGGLVILEGRVIRVESERMEAVDVATGETAWETAVPSASQYGLLTDGRLVLRAERDGGDVVVTARGVEDGRTRWQADVPDDVQHLFVVSGRMYGYTSEGLVALREGDA